MSKPHTINYNTLTLPILATLRIYIFAEAVIINSLWKFIFIY